MPETIVLRVQANGIQAAQQRLAALAAHGRNLRVPLARAGAIILKAVDDNFEAEGRPTRWKPRAALTLAALRGEAEGRARQTSRYQKAKKLSTKVRMLKSAAAQGEGRKILQVSGGLRGSMTMMVDGNRVVVGSAHPAARIHQLGGVIRPKMAKALMIPVGPKLYQLVQVTIPARPFLVLTGHDEHKIVQVLIDWLDQDRMGALT